ncbi:nucleoside-diphosphate kinase [Streptococcus bovimastitidis]|uniref:Nucleoside diphosphate kinase n=1 Tax=Streptococcus bovimastitidis TaxID=1856638 RepID=A0A1L8MNE3_9STRE|nr:nucleoside-diphosphate kinase [Streptococcus bovimastitidis]OJF72290.1 nucleoside-diphosphate kinase [Streptococcus bovimastitidis]
MEKTFFMIKPDGVKRGLVGDVLARMEKRGFTFDQLQLVTPTKEQFDQHYYQLVDKPFYPGMMDYMMSGPILIGIISGYEVIESWRTMMGKTNPKEAAPGTIRSDFAQAPNDKGEMMNVVHGSDSRDSAKREIELWFGKEAAEEVK